MVDDQNVDLLLRRHHLESNLLSKRYGKRGRFAGGIEFGKCVRLLGNSWPGRVGKYSRAKS